MRPRAPGLLFCAVLTAAPATAAGPATTDPVRLRADRIELDQRSGVSRYQGRVVLTHGTLRLTAERAEARGRREAIEHIRTEGRPTTFRYLPAGELEIVEGEARRAEYDLVARQLDLTGAVELRQGRNLLRAASLHYDLGTETIVAHADAERRIHAALAPRPRADARPEARP